MNITVYCGSSSGKDPRFAEAARELGEWIGSHGHALVYGGSSIGLMGIVARTTMEAGGSAYGVEPRFFIDAGVAQCDLTRLFVVESMAERKAKMIVRGAARRRGDARGDLRDHVAYPPGEDRRAVLFPQHRRVLRQPARLLRDDARPGLHRAGCRNTLRC